MEGRQQKRRVLRYKWFVVVLQLALILPQVPGVALGLSSTSPVADNDGQLLLDVGGLGIIVNSDLEPAIGELLALKVQDRKGESVTSWNYNGGSLQATLRPAPQGVFLNLTIQLAGSCSCQTDAALTVTLMSLRDDLDSVILSTTPVSQLAPPRESQILIQSMDYYTLRSLYGVAAAFVLKSGSTLEIVSLYPFASISYDPEGNGAIRLAFRKGLGDLSASPFQSGDTKSVMFYLGSPGTKETMGNAFTAFAQDVETIFPTRDLGKPFIFYAVDGGSWSEVAREAESLGYSVVYSSLGSQYTTKKGGGHYFGLGWEQMERLEKAGLVSALVLGRDGKYIGDGKAVRVNPSDSRFQAWLRRQIDEALAKRRWFIADGVDVLQDFDALHSNALEGYVQVLNYVRSTGRGIIYNPFHTPHLWLDWLADGVLVEAPTGLYRFDGTRVDYMTTREFYSVTREFVRIRSQFFPNRVTVWHDYVSIDDSSLQDSVALCLMEGADSFSFSTNKQGSARVRPGEITRVTWLLSKMDSIRALRLGSVMARSFGYSELERSWTFEALSAGAVMWIGGIQTALVGGNPTDVESNESFSTFYIQTPAQVTLVPLA